MAEKIEKAFKEKHPEVTFMWPSTEPPVESASTPSKKKRPVEYKVMFGAGIHAMFGDQVDAVQIRAHDIAGVDTTLKWVARPVRRVTVSFPTRSE